VFDEGHIEDHLQHLQHKVINHRLCSKEYRQQQDLLFITGLGVAGISL
jgi:hypothetical protein